MKEQQKKHLIDIMQDDEKLGLYEETIEEASEKYSSTAFSGRQDLYDGFIAGAKWQAERSYSEEEVIELLQKALTHKDDGEIGSLVTAQGEIRPANFFSWFEQFKKK